MAQLSINLHVLLQHQVPYSLVSGEKYSTCLEAYMLCMFLDKLAHKCIVSVEEDGDGMATFFKCITASAYFLYMRAFIYGVPLCASAFAAKLIWCNVCNVSQHIAHEWIDTTWSWSPAPSWSSVICAHTAACVAIIWRNARCSMSWSATTLMWFSHIWSQARRAIVEKYTHHGVGEHVCWSVSGFADVLTLLCSLHVGKKWPLVTALLRNALREEMAFSDCASTWSPSMPAAVDTTFNVLVELIT